VQAEVWIWVVVAAALAAALTGVARRLALRLGWIDVPNPRSSHVASTPRGGGVALVVVILPAVAMGLPEAGAGAAVLALAAAAVAAIGLADDLRPLSVPVRLVVQAGAVAAGLWAAGSVPPLDLGGHVLAPGPVAYGLLALACLWFVNLYNFMDGIDGIAAAEAAFVGLAAAWLVGAAGAPAGLQFAWAVLGGASLGFLAWNWAPARVFMGDVGSGFLGFMIAMLLLQSIREGALSVAAAVVLVAPFLVDTTVTLLRRMARGERWYLAHRTHAYQWLARRWGSHARVTSLSVLLNLALVAPAAWACQRHPQNAAWIAGTLLALLSLLAWRAGAGRPEQATGGTST
jgi:Fuc2NAc and GlcNAc transferase